MFLWAVSVSLLFGAPVDPAAGERCRFLFIGNSYTATNDLPGLLEALGPGGRCATIETQTRERA